VELYLAVLLWLAGCAGRFILPYLASGLQAVGNLPPGATWADVLAAWPAWEWKLLTAFLLASGVFGGSLLFPAVRETLQSMSIEAIILAGYVGQDLGRQVVKAIPARQA